MSTQDDTKTQAPQPRNNLAEARAILFDTIRETKAGTLEVARARVINDLLGTALDTERVVIEKQRVTGEEIHSTFIEAEIDAPPQLPAGAIGRIVHRLR